MMTNEAFDPSPVLGAGVDAPPTAACGGTSLPLSNGLISSSTRINACQESSQTMFYQKNG